MINIAMLRMKLIILRLHGSPYEHTLLSFHAVLSFQRVWASFIFNAVYNSQY